MQHQPQPTDDNPTTGASVIAPQTTGARIKNSAKLGFRSGSRTAWWMIRMMLPVTFGVTILKWLGVLDILAQWLTPALKVIGLTAEGALAFITSCLANLYGVIAVISTLDIDFRMATILAVMGLICHNLIVETMIQRKAGANPVFMVILRITAAVIAAWALNNILPADYTGRLIIERRTEVAATGLGGMLAEWGLSMLRLIPMMFLLIVVMNTTQQLLREFKIIDYLTIPFKPLMNLLGLSRQSSLLWIVMNTLGLAYGGAILIADYDAGLVGKREAKLLNTHVALSHSLLEDTLIFAAIGVGFFWLFVPRMILAIIAVWGQRLFMKLRTGHSR